jgi:hypothetical protein
MLLKLGIASAIGYGIYRYAMSSQKLASASSSGETGGGIVRPHNQPNPYSPTDNFAGAPGMTPAGDPVMTNMPPAIGQRLFGKSPL